MKSKKLHFHSIHVLTLVMILSPPPPPGQSVAAMEALSSCVLSYSHLGKCEPAACRSVLNLCKWLLVDWKDLTPQLKQARTHVP